MPIIKNTAQFLLAGILLIFLCFSCNFSQKEATKKNILQVDYYVRYLQGDKQLKVNISFTSIDSTEKIIPQRMEEVLFVNQALSGKKVGSQYRYQLEKEIPFAEKYELKYRLSPEKMDSLTIAMQAISDFSVKKGKVSKTAGTNLTFVGEKQVTEETLVLLFNDSHHKTATIQIDNHSLNAPITILPEQVHQLAIGKGKLYIVKKNRIQTKLAHTEVLGLTEYYSIIQEIEIIE